MSKRPPIIEMYVDGAREYRWRIVAGNGEIIGDSAESYRHRGDCEHSARLVAPDAPIRFIDPPLA